MKPIILSTILILTFFTALMQIDNRLLTGNQQENGLPITTLQTNFLPASADVDIKTLVFRTGGEEYVRICECESQCGKYKENWEGSSAFGLFQFMPQTFSAYCEGSIESNIDQLKCFDKLIKTHRDWWEC